MLTVDIPGYKNICIANLALDFNGTVAIDGELIPGVENRLLRLSKDLKIYILTADTFGNAPNKMGDVPCRFLPLSMEKQEFSKLNHINQLGSEKTCAVGNGRNDRFMLKAAVLGIGLIQREGAAMETLMHADIICTDILDALDLLLNPLRLVATLRS